MSATRRRRPAAGCVRGRNSAAECAHARRFQRCQQRLLLGQRRRCLRNDPLREAGAPTRADAARRTGAAALDRRKSPNMSQQLRRGHAIIDRDEARMTQRHPVRGEGAVEQRHIQLLGARKPPSGPPTWTERSRRPSRSPPPSSSMILRMGMPSSTSYTPGAANASLRQASFVPVSGALPRLRRPPRHGRQSRARRRGFDIVDRRRCPEQPDEVGYGGLGRTAPRRPSSAWSRAVSSPAT